MARRNTKAVRNSNRTQRQINRERKLVDKYPVDQRDRFARSMEKKLNIGVGGEQEDA